MKQYDKWDKNGHKIANNLMFNAWFEKQGLDINGKTKREKYYEKEDVLILDKSYLTVGALRRKPYSMHLAFGSWHRNSKSGINSAKLFLVKHRLFKIITVYKNFNIKKGQLMRQPFFSARHRA